MKLEEAASVAVNTMVPVDVHPGGFKAENRAGDMTRRGLAALYSTTSQILDAERKLVHVATGGKVVHGGKIVAQSYVPRAVELGKVSQKRFEAALRAVESARDGLGKLVATANREVRKAVVPAGLDAVASAQVRDYWRGRLEGRESAEALLALRTAVLDERTSGAILGQPEYLTGLTPEQGGQLYAVAAEHHSPEWYREREDGNAGARRLSSAGETCERLMAEKLALWLGSISEEEALASLREGAA